MSFKPIVVPDADANRRLPAILAALDAWRRSTRRMVRGDPRYQIVALPKSLATVKGQREGERAIEIIEDGAASRYSSEVGSRYPPALRPTMALAHRTGWFLA